MSGPDVREVETQFVLAVPSELLPMLQRPGDRLLGGFSQALALIFGLPFGTPVRMSVKGADGFQLLEANGQGLASPSPAEVRAALTGAFAAMLVVTQAQVTSIDLLKERVTDA